MYTCAHIYTYIYIYTHVYIYIYTYIYIYNIYIAMYVYEHRAPRFGVEGGIRRLNRRIPQMPRILMFMWSFWARIHFGFRVSGSVIGLGRGDGGWGLKVLGFGRRETRDSNIP